MAPTLAYWDLRGLAEPIRQLLHYAGQEFEDKRYTNFDDWNNDKFNLQLDFPNLPYYIDGDVRISQSAAILRYVARKHKLAGASECQRTRVDVAEQQLTDFRLNLIRASYSPEFEKIKGDLIKSIPSQLKLWSAFLGDQKFLAGDAITYVDFMAYEIFNFYELLVPSLLKDFPSLNEFQSRIENLPQLQSYFKSSTYKRWPILGPLAHFGGKGEAPKEQKRS